MDDGDVVGVLMSEVAELHVRLARLEEELVEQARAMLLVARCLRWLSDRGAV